MPPGVPTRLRGRAPRAVNAQKPEGRGRTGRPGGGGGEKWGWESEGRAASRSSPASARPPQPGSYSSRLRQVHRSTTEKTPPPEAEMLLSPQFPSPAPSFLRLFSPGLSPKREEVWGEGKKMAKKRVTSPSRPHRTSPPTCFPTVAARAAPRLPGGPRPLPRYSQERGH